MATGHTDNTVKLWDLASGRQIDTLWGHSRDVVAVSFVTGQDDLLSLWSGSPDRTLMHWDLSHETGQVTAAIPGVNCLACSPNGDRLIIGHVDGAVNSVECGLERVPGYTGSARKTYSGSSHLRGWVIGLRQRR